MPEATTMTMTPETTEPKAKVGPPMPADVRALVLAFAEGVLTRSDLRDLTDGHREQLARIKVAVDQVQIVYPGGYSPKYSDEWDKIKALTDQWVKAVQGARLIHYEGLEPLRAPAVGDELARRGLHTKALELVAAIDGHVRIVNDAAERLAEGLRQQVGIFDQLVTSDPVAAALVSALGVLRQRWIRYLAGDTASEFDGEVNNQVLSAIRRIVLVKRVPLHTHMLENILPAWEAQKKADETAKAAVDVPQRGKRTR